MLHTHTHTPATCQSMTGHHNIHAPMHGPFHLLFFILRANQVLISSTI